MSNEQRICRCHQICGGICVYCEERLESELDQTRQRLAEALAAVEYQKSQKNECATRFVEVKRARDEARDDAKRMLRQINDSFEVSCWLHLRPYLREGEE